MNSVEHNNARQSDAFRCVRITPGNVHQELHQTKQSGAQKWRKSLCCKWAHLDSNQGPTDYESAALTD